MSFFSKIFRNKKKETTVVISNNINVEKIYEFKEFMDALLNQNKYIAKSEYLKKLESYKPYIDYYSVLKDNNILLEFCNKNHLNINFINDVLSCYEIFINLVERHNELFIIETMKEKQEYLDNLLKEVDPNIILDEDQRKVVLTDEDYTLVIAGAGAGKTTTVAAKVKYLVDNQNIAPEDILVVSFTNKAVGELKDRLNKDLNIPCPIATFHSVGNAILRKQTNEKLNIVDSSKLYWVLQDYFKNSLLKNGALVNNLILFFASYFDAPFEGDDLNAFFEKIAKANYTTMKSELSEFQNKTIDARTKRAVTIQSEILRSRQEVEIANFLYLNGIDYEYEPTYKYDICLAKKPYTPDFLIKQGDNVAYLEHFGITEDGKNNRYSEDEIENYKKAINEKILIHQTHQTKLIYTFSAYKDNRSLTEHLREALERNGFIFKPRSQKEILEKLIVSEESKYIRKLVSLVSRFISNFKTNGYTSEDFNRMYHSTNNVRSKLFLNICHECYLEYQHYLKENSAVDFEDMINESARILREIKEMKEKLSFKYIIVDEYQDISKQRFDLVTALSEVTNAKIIAVGDDWQSIYAFSGSDITLFTHFEEKMGYAKLLKIVKTYRNSQEVIDIAGNFIQKNKSQITKELKSPKTITNPVIIYTYDGTFKKNSDTTQAGANYNMAKAIETALEQIISYNEIEGKPRDSSILLLGRFTFDGDVLEKTGLFEFSKYQNRLRSVKYPYLNITVMTAHASKGLGYDNVIVINGKNDLYGFPAKLEDDPVLSFVIKEDKNYEYAEERRLFYVAMTRTKNRVYFVAPEQNPSEFLLEIKKDFKNIILNGSWNEEISERNRKYCPICGYPLQYRFKSSYGLRLYICTNEPELCSFMTNDYDAGKLSIMKCDSCRDGYLIVKRGIDKYFLGCTNYKNDGTGCNRTSYGNYSKIDNKKKTTEDNAVKPKNTNIKVDERIIEIVKPDIAAVFYRDMDLNFIVWTILKGLQSISQKRFFGVSGLINFLRGSESEQIKRNKLAVLEGYGALKMLSFDELNKIIYWLIDEHYILKTNHPKYPVLHMTYKSNNYSTMVTSRKLDNLKKLLEEIQ
ncbi:MAG: DNA helicase UvrD [Firmicutes bacterium]|nr:DNA helicase UvrD [Bacillota bacterium]